MISQCLFCVWQSGEIEFVVIRSFAGSVNCRQKPGNPYVLRHIFGVHQIIFFRIFFSSGEFSICDPFHFKSRIFRNTHICIIFTCRSLYITVFRHGDKQRSFYCLFTCHYCLVSRHRHNQSLSIISAISMILCPYWSLHII